MSNKQSIKVDPAVMEDAAVKIDKLAEDYNKAYDRLYSGVGGLAAYWQGKDNLAFTNQIEGFRDDFKAMKNLMEQYADYLKLTAKNYSNTQDDRTTQAQKLTN